MHTISIRSKPEACIPYCNSYWYTLRMTTQVPTRFSDHELEALDTLVANGVARSRSDAIRLAVSRLADVHRRHQIGQQIAQAYIDNPQSEEEDDLAIASAIAMTESEPW